MELNYKSFGEGQPILILHGLFGSLDNWQTLGKQFADHFSVYLLDLRNHGKSPHSSIMDYPSMAEDIAQFIHQHQLPAPHLIGHSMGGKVALQLAARYPNLINQLVVVDITPKSYPGGHHDIFEAMFAIDPASLANRKDADEALQQHLADAGIRQFLLKNLKRAKPSGFEWKMNLPVIFDNYQALLAPIDFSTPYPGKTQFIRGMRSNYIQAHDYRMLQELFTAAEITEIEGAGHWVHAEAPRALYEEVLRFLSPAS